MRSLLLLLFLAASVPALGLERPETCEEPATLATPLRLRVPAGRAMLLSTEREIRSVTRASGTQTIGARTFVEVAPRSRLEIVQRGRLSLRIDGPASLAAAPARALGGDPELELISFAHVELEVRRGRPRLSLPGERVLLAESCALSLEQEPDGRLEVTHHGGGSAWLEDGERVRPIAPGERLVFEPRRP